MAYTKTVWEARQGVKLNKFTKSEETETSIVLTNTPDSITEPGTPFSVENMNHIEEGIAEAHETKAPIDSPTFTGTPKVPNKTSAPVSDGTLIATEAQVKMALLDYSTDEQDTGIKWIDGRSIYRKVVTTINAITGGTWGNIGVGVSSNKIIKAIGLHNDGSMIIINQLYPTGECFISTGTSLSAGSLVILEYVR